MGKGRTFSDPARDSVYQKEYDNEVYSTATQQNSYNLGSTHFSDQSGIGNFTQAGSDQRKASIKGALFQGNIGFNQQTAVLDVPSTTINLLEDGASAPLALVSTDRIVALSTGTVSDLVTITGAQRPGQRLFLYGILGNTITIKHTVAATANTILTPDEGDFDFSDNMVIELVYDISTSKWRIVGTPAGGGGGITFPITPPVDVRGNVSTTQNIDLSLTTAHSTTMTLTGNITITFSNIPTAATQIEWEIEIKQDATGGRTITWPASVTPTPILDSDADATTIVLLRVNDGGTIIRTVVGGGSGGGDASLWANFTAVNNVNVGNFDILAVKNMDFDNATSTIQGLKELRFFDDDPNKNIQSAVDELSFNVPALDQFSFYANAVEMLRIEEASAGVYQLDMLDHAIENVKDLAFDDSATFAGAGAIPTIGYDLGTTEFRFNSVAASNFSWTFNNVERMSLSDGNLTFADGTLVIFNPDATNAGMNVGIVAGDPSATTVGDIWYDFSANKFRANENSVDVDLIGGGGEVFTWTANHDADGWDFILTQDGFGSIKTDRNVAIPAEEIWFFVNNAGAERNVMVFDNAAAEVRIVAPFALNPSGNTQTLGIDSDRWDTVFVDAYLDMDDSGVPGLPGAGEGRLFWESATESFHQIDPAGIDTDLASPGGASANQQLSNLSGTVRPNLNLLAGQAAGGILGSATPGDEWFSLFVQRLRYPVFSSVLATEYMITTDGTPDRMIFNVPTGALFSWSINATTQMDLTTDRLQLASANLDMDGNLIENSGDITLMVDNTDIGDSTIPLGQLFTRQIEFPDLVSGLTGANRQIVSQTLGGASSIVMNLPTDQDFIITENAETTNFLLQVDTSANILRVGIGASLLAMNLNDKSMAFGTGAVWQFNATSLGYNFGGGNTSLDDNDLTDVHQIDIVTPAGAAVASIIGFDATPDILQLDLGNSTDFLFTDNGSTRVSWINTTNIFSYEGCTIFRLPDETTISDRTTAPGTPPAGKASLYVINSSGAQSLRVKFDNGTEKTIADDT